MKVKAWRSIYGNWYEFDGVRLDHDKEYRATVQFPDGFTLGLPVIWEGHTERVPEHAAWEEWTNYSAKVRVTFHGFDVDVPIETLDVVAITEVE